MIEKIKEIQEFVDSIRRITENDLSASNQERDQQDALNVACANLDDLLDYVKQAMNNNITSYGAICLSTAANPNKPTATSVNPNNGLVNDLDEDWVQGVNDQATYILSRTQTEDENPMGMSMALFDYNGNIVEGTTGSPPIQMKGTKGAPGKDGTITEEIYLLGNEDGTPDTPFSQQTDGDTPYDDNYQRFGTKTPSGVDSDHPVEYYSKRNKVNNVWENWSDPVIWSKGAVSGRDGNGVEYIFCVTASETVLPKQPTGLENTDEGYFEWPLEVRVGDKVYKWYDDPPKLSPGNVCWCSMRKQKYENGIQVGGPFSEPSIGSRYSLNGNDGGGRSIFAYCITNWGEIPATPIGGSGNPKIWDSATPPVDPNDNYLWTLEPKDGGGKYAVWLSTCVFYSDGSRSESGGSKPICITSEDGINGKDGQNMQFIYRLLHSVDDLRALQQFHVIARKNGVELENYPDTDEAPLKIDIISNSSQFTEGGISLHDWEKYIDETGEYYSISNTTGTDEPHGIDGTNYFVECVCVRTKEKNVRPDGTVVEEGSAWSDPVPWAVGGEDGIDGEGVEYIYLVTPQKMPIIVDDVEEEWDLLEHYRHCKREGTTPYWLHIPTYEEYLAFDEENGTDYAEKYKDYDFIPGITDNNVFNLIQEWSDEPQDVDTDQPYEWVAIRKKRIEKEGIDEDEDGNASEYIGDGGDFSTPKLWNKFAADGVSSIMAYAFTRSNDKLNEILIKYEKGIDGRPKGGSFESPCPDPTSYIKGGIEHTVNGYDSIPDGDSSDDIGMTSRFFSSVADITEDGETVDDSWSIPCKMTDRSDFQVEFVGYNTDSKSGIINEKLVPSPNSFNTYYKNAQPTDGKTKLEVAEEAWREEEKTKGGNGGDNVIDAVGMATCRLKNGEWTDWQVVKVKGETGAPGTSVRIIGSAYLENDCDNYPELQNPTSIRKIGNKHAIFVMLYCAGSDKGTIYKWYDANPEDGEEGANGSESGYEKYHTPILVGDGGLINGELGVGDGDSFENVGQIQGPAGESTNLYIVFSNDDSVLEEDAEVSIDLTLKVGKYIGYYAGPQLDTTTQQKSSTYFWSRWEGQDGGGQEQVFLLTKASNTPNYPLSRDSGPTIPTDSEANKHQPEWRPKVDSALEHLVSPNHYISENQGDYKKGEYRWSDVPLTPNAEYPFCGVMTRTTTTWQGKGSNGKAVLYSEYVTSGTDATYLELSEDSVSVPLNMSGEIDLKGIVFDLTATLYSGATKITDVTYHYSFDGEKYTENSEEITEGVLEPKPLISITKDELLRFRNDKGYFPNVLYVKVEWEGGEGIKSCKINYGTMLFELSISSSVLRKDLETGRLFDEYDKLSVYAKKGVNQSGISAPDETVYARGYDIQGDSDTKSASTSSNGIAEFSGLSSLQDISSIEFYLTDKNNYEICNEKIGIVSDGKDGAGQEFIYKLYPAEVTNWEDLSIEFTNDVTQKTTNNIGQKYNDSDYVPNGGSDDPQQLTYENKYQYVSVRKKGTAGWSKFSTPTLWSRLDVNLQVHIPSETVIVYNAQAGLGLKTDDIVSINLVITENGVAILPAKDNSGNYKITLGDIQDGEISKITPNEDEKTFAIELKYTGSNITSEAVSFNLPLNVDCGYAIISGTHTVRSTQGGGENAIHLELTNDNETVRKTADGNGVDDVTKITTKAILYDGKNEADDTDTVTYEAECVGCTGNIDEYGVWTASDITASDKATVTITGKTANYSASKVFTINITKDKDVYKLKPSITVYNKDRKEGLYIRLTKNETWLNSLPSGFKIEYTIGSKDYTATLGTALDLSDDFNGTTFNLIDGSGKILDSESVGVIYDGKAASYYTVSANYSSCAVSEGENLSIYPIVRLVTDKSEGGETWTLNSTNSLTTLAGKVYYETSDTGVAQEYNGNPISSGNLVWIKFYYDHSGDKLSSLSTCPMFEVSISHLKQGDVGSAPVIYPAGKYDPYKEYESTSKMAPYVYVESDDKHEYYIAYGKGTGKDPNSYQEDSPDWNNVPTTELTWVPMTKYDAIYSDIGMFNTALVGQWVFYKNYMFSQEGKNSSGVEVSYEEYLDNIENDLNSNFIPNILFNAKEGSVQFASGNVVFNKDGSCQIGKYSYTLESNPITYYGIEVTSDKVKFGGSITAAPNETTITAANTTTVKITPGSVKVSNSGDCFTATQGKMVMNTADITTANIDTANITGGDITATTLITSNLQTKNIYSSVASMFTLDFVNTIFPPGDYKQKYLQVFNNSDEDIVINIMLGKTCTIGPYSTILLYCDGTNGSYSF